jgi:hypothetical protein
MPPDAGRFVHQINLKARFGQIKGGLNTADPAADHQDISIIAVRSTFKKPVNLFFFHFSISLWGPKSLPE